MRSPLTKPTRPRARRARATGFVLTAILVAAAASYLLISQALISQAEAQTQMPAQGSSAPGAPLGIEDGYVESGSSISPFADDLPALANLDPALREAMQAAAADARDDGFEFVVTSGWRSEKYQQTLFDDAVRDYGSAEEARRHVATATTSTHVTGNAVDIGFTNANSWLSQHGSDYGLCQTFANEMWHYELATAPGGDCPPQLPDSSYR